MMSSLITVLFLLFAQYTGATVENGWRMDASNPSRTNVSPLPGPTSLPTFRVIASNVQASLKRTADDGSLVLTDGTNVASYTDSGQLRWRTNALAVLNGPVVDVAVASSGVVYASSTKTVIALDPITGQPGWAQPFLANSGDESAPLIVGKDGTVYFHTGSKAGGFQERFTAINPDGTRKWDYLGNTGRGYRPAVFSTDQSTVYLYQLGASGELGKAVGLSSVSGQVLLNSACDVRSGVYAFKDVLNTGGANSNLLKLPTDIQNCEVSATGLLVTDTAAVLNAGLLVVQTSLPGTGSSYAAIDSQGRTLWSRIESLSGGFADTPANEARGTFFAVAPRTNEVVAIRIATGEELWRQRFPGPISGLELGADEKLYLVSGSDLFRGDSQVSGSRISLGSPGIANPSSSRSSIGLGRVAMDVLPGQVAAFGFSEGTGTTTADSSGNGFNGTLANGASWTTGKNGNGLSFDGIDDKVILPATLDIAALPFTLEAWVKPSSFADWGAFFSKRDAYSSSQMRFDVGLAISTGRVYVSTFNSIITFAYGPPLDTWTHLSVEADSTGTMLYVNGVLSQTLAAVTLGTGSTAAVAIGSSADDDDHFAGVIDDLHLYSRALSQTEVQTDMSTPIGAADTTPPTAPTGLTATVAGSTQINLTWTASTDNVGVTGYRVERCQGTGCSNFGQLATPAGTSFNDTGLTAGTSYSYRVRATDAAGNLSVYSNTATATTTAPDITPPTVPSNLTATAASSSQINLTWTASIDNVGVTGYRVERCQGAGCASFAQIATPAGTTYNDLGLTAATSYSYRVLATDAAGNLSGYSTVAIATTNTAPPASGPVAAYSFDAGTGTTLADLSGNGNAGTITSGTWTASGKYGSALVFNGTSSRVTINDSASLHLTAGMTLEAWVYPTVTPSGWTDLIYKQNDSYYLEAASTAGVGPTVGGTFGNGWQNSAAGSVLPVNTWTHVAATFDGTKLAFWINGINVASQLQSSPLTVSTLPLQIGGDSLYGQNFTGRIDEVRVYNRALTQTELELDMNTPVGPVGDTTPPTAPANARGAAGGAPPSVISRQSYINSGSFASHTSAAFDSTGGDLIVIFGSSHQNATMTLTDSKGNTWISAAGPTNHTPGVDLRSRVWYAKTPNVGMGHTVTITLSPAQPLVISVLVIKGSNTTAPIDVISAITDDGGTATTSIASATINTTQPADLLIDFAKSAVGVTQTAGTGYTFEGMASSNYLAAEDSIASGAGSYSAGWTIAPAANWQNVLLGVVSANASASSNQITLTWNPSTDNTGVTGYLIDRCLGSGCSNFVQIGTTAGFSTTSYTDTGLSTGTTYTYRVRAKDAAGNLGAYSSVVSATTTGASDTTPPTAPTNLAAAVVSTSQINLTWTASTDNIGVTSYMIERCQGAGCSSFTQIGTSTTASYPNTGLSDGTSYSYRVRATDAVGNLSGYSTTASAVTNALPPTAPANLIATASGGTQINLSWTASTSSIGISNYLVERCQGTGCSNFVQIATPTATSYSDTGLTSVTTYSYRVRARDTQSTLSGYSNTASATTTDGVPPSAPSNVTGTASSTTQINLTWTASTDNVGVTGYTIEACQGAGCSSFAQVGTSTAASYSNTGLLPATSYSYRVLATDAAGNLSSYSNITSTLTDASPTAPALTATAAGGTQIDLSWTASTGSVGISNYLVERCQGAGCSNFVQVATSTTTTYSNTGLTSATSYSYRVRAIDTHNNLGGYSNTASATTADTVPPSAPSNLTGTTSGTSQINLTWTASTDNVAVTGYTIEACQAVGCSTFAQIGTSTAASYSHTGLSDGTSYSYRVRATDAAGNLSSYSNTASAVTNALPPTAPSNLTATASGGTQINLSWTASTSSIGILNYLIERSPVSVVCTGNFVQIGTSATTTYLDTGVASGLSYCYRVRASDTNNTLGGYSNTANATTPDIIPPTVPTNLTATPASPTSINLNWTSSTDNLFGISYQVERCQGPGCTNFVQVATAISITGNLSAWLDAGPLAVSTSYSYRIRAIDNAGNLSGYSNAATGVTPADTTPPTAPANSVAFAGGTPASIIAWQEYNQGASLTTHTTATLDSTGGDLILVYAWSNTTVATMSISDSKGNAWISAAGPTSHSSPSVNLRTQLWYVKAANVGTGHTITVNLSTAGPLIMRTLVIKGSNTTAPIDATSGITDNGGTATTSITSAAINTTQPGDLLIDFAKTSPAGTPTAGTGYTDYNSQSIASEYSFSSAAGSYVAGWTMALAENWQNVLTGVVSANASLSSSQITVTWNSSSDDVGVTGYLIERCAGAGCSNFAQIGSTGSGAAFYNDTTVSASTTYSYRVRATDAAGNLGSYSSTSSAATTADTTPPTAPANLTAATASASQINLTWTASTDNVGVTGYMIERCQGSGCNNFAQIGTSTSTSYSDTGLSAGTSYSYRVRATDGANLSVYSNTASDVTGTPPTAPGNPTVTAASETVIDVSWTASTSSVGISYYTVERCQGGGCPNFVQIATPVTTSYSDTGLTPATFYSYRVRAVDTQGNLSGYNVVGTYTVDTVPPSAPSNLTATATSFAEIDLTWTPSTDNIGVMGYQLERCQGAGCSSFTQITTGFVGCSVPTGLVGRCNIGLIPGTSYSYRVRAVDIQGNLGSYSNVATATTISDTTPPTAPSNLTATAAGSGQINLGWTASTDGVAVTGYMVERCQGAGCATFAQIATPAGTSYNDTGLAGGTSYSYRVRATDAAGNLSAYSTIVSATTVAPPTAPTNLTATAAGATQINLSWTASTSSVGILNYLIERCQNGPCGNFVQVGTSTTTTYADTGLTSGTNYTYRVRASDTNNTLGAYSTTASATTVDIVPPSDPSNLTATPGNRGQIVLAWTASTDNLVGISYLIERCQGAGCASLALVATITPLPGGSGYLDTGLLDVTSYSYRARARDAAGNLSIGYSNVATAVTISGDVTPPTVPSNMTAIPGGTPPSVIARQSYMNSTSLTTHSTAPFDSTGADLIVVFGSSHANVTMTLSDNKGNTWISAAGPTNHVPGVDLRSQVWYAKAPNMGTGHTLTMNLSLGQPLVISVVVIKGSNTTAPLDVISAITDDGGVATTSITSAAVNTTKAGDLLIDFGKVSVGVAWTAGAGYTFENTASSNYLAAEDALAGSIGSYNAGWTTNLAVNWQNVLLGVASANASTSSTQITLMWSPSTDDTGVTGYRIERCTGSGCSTFSEVGATGTPTPSFTDINLSVGTTYTYRIRATDAAGNFSGYSNTISATTTDPVPPSAPSSLTTTVASSSQINLSWTASTDNIGVTGYRIERCQGTGCSNFAQIQTTTSTSYSDTGLSQATSYSYRVRATDAGGNFSGYSNTASATTDTPPTAPSTLTATAAGGTQINLSWIASSSSIGISNYLLERCQGAGCSNFAQIATSTTTTYSDTGLTPATTYSYRLRATDTHNNVSAYSNTASATTADTVAPSAPSSLTSTAISSSQINLSWTASTDNVGVTGYRVERCQGAGCTTFTEIATPAGTSYNNTGLAASTSYSYRVRATDAAGNLSGYSNVATQATPSANGPAVAYAFNEGTGLTTADSTGNGFTGTLTNGPIWIAGHTGNAISFDGVDDKVSLPSTLDVTALPFTLEAWVRPVNRSDWHVIFSKRSSYSAAGMRFDVGLETSTGRVYVTTFTTTRTFTFAPALNTWTHVAVVADSTGTRLYVNGVLQQSLAVVTLGTGSTAAVNIARTGDDSDAFAGAIDDLRFYKRSLTQAEIQTDMNTPVP